MKAKSLLGLREKSSLKEIKNRYRRLMNEWHPDKHPNNIEQATQMSAKINEAYKTILEYTSNYEYPFDEESLKEAHLSPSEWMEKRFGNKKETI